MMVFKVKLFFRGDLVSEAAFHKALHNVGVFVRKEARRLCPTDSGELKARMQFKTAKRSVTIFNDTPYAVDMEYGRPPEAMGRPVSIEEQERILDWAVRHDAKNPYGVVQSVRYRGIAPYGGTYSESETVAKNPLHITSFGRNSFRPFLRPAIYNNLPEIRDIMLKSIVEQP